MKTITLIIILFAQISIISGQNKLYNNIDSALKYSENVFYLYLEDKNLNQEQLLQFKNLKTIALINCNPNVFISCAHEFKSLEEIIIEYNLEELPKSIGKCTRLKKLIIFKSVLNKLPKEIGQLNNLVVLHINYCPIKSFPKEIYKLNNLKSFMCSWGENKHSISIKKRKEIQMKIKKTMPECKVLF